MQRILAAIVLYRMEVATSPAYRSFCAALHCDQALQEVYRLVIFDNSPQAQALPRGYADTYVHDGGNPGLAKPYTQALALAEVAGIPWLLLLDQDTIVTTSYLVEAATLAASQFEDAGVAAIVPKLMQDARVQSPHTPIGLRPSRPIALKQTGKADEELHVFNSGAMLRVSSVKAVGGFPLDYPMEYLDYATFRMLQREGDRLYIMNATLEHELAMRAMLLNSAEDLPERMRRVFEHEARFYRQFGSQGERFAHRLRLIVRALRAYRTGAHRRAVLLIRIAGGARC